MHKMCILDGMYFITPLAFLFDLMVQHIRVGIDLIAFEKNFIPKL